MWNGLSKSPFAAPLESSRGAPNQGFGAWLPVSRRRGPGVNTQRPQAEGRGRTVLRPGRRLLLVSPQLRWRARRCSTTCRGPVDRGTATMMYASRNRG